MEDKEAIIKGLTHPNQLHRLLVCFELSKVLVTTFDMESLVKAVVARFNEIIPASNWSILLLDPDADELQFLVAVGLTEDQISKLQNIRIKVGQGIAGLVAQKGEPIFIRNAQEDARFYPGIDKLTGFTTRSIICLPLFASRKVIGVLEVVNIENENFFLQTYLPLLNILADYIAIAVDNVRNFQKIQAKSFIDDLTGFYNTRYLTWILDRLVTQVVNSGSKLSVVFLDLDNFKQVVDHHGHLLGSKVLQEVSQVIGRMLSPQESLIRYGGDEFIILMPHKGKEEAYDFVCSLRRAVNQTCYLTTEGLNITLTASYGIATLPDDAQDQAELLELADTALFSSKDRGKDQIVIGSEVKKEP